MKIRNLVLWSGAGIAGISLGLYTHRPKTLDQLLSEALDAGHATHIDCHQHPDCMVSFVRGENGPQIKIAGAPEFDTSNCQVTITHEPDGGRSASMWCQP